MLSSDLRECSEPSMKANLGGEGGITKGVMQGTQLLQIMEARDVAQSLQTLKDRKEGEGGTGTGRRVLKLVLSDGKHRFVGLEYSKLSKLPTDLAHTPGAKIMVKNVVVTEGIALLSDKNTQILGGACSSLLEWRDRLLGQTSAADEPAEEPVVTSGRRTSASGNNQANRGEEKTSWAEGLPGEGCSEPPPSSSRRACAAVTNPYAARGSSSSCGSGSRAAAGRDQRVSGGKEGVETAVNQQAGVRGSSSVAAPKQGSAVIDISDSPSPTKPASRSSRVPKAQSKSSHRALLQEFAHAPSSAGLPRSTKGASAWSIEDIRTFGDDNMGFEYDDPGKGSGAGVVPPPPTLPEPPPARHNLGGGGGVASSGSSPASSCPSQGIGATRLSSKRPLPTSHSESLAGKSPMGQRKRLRTPITHSKIVTLAKAKALPRGVPCAVRVDLLSVITAKLRKTTYKVVVSCSDASGECEVKLSNQLVTQIAGMSCAAYRTAVAADPSCNDQLNEKLQNGVASLFTHTLEVVVPIKSAASASAAQRQRPLGSSPSSANDMPEVRRKVTIASVNGHPAEG
ncbi:unnamed protein product [Chrysoparadoxa australica]